MKEIYFKKDEFSVGDLFVEIPTERNINVPILECSKFYSIFFIYKISEGHIYFRGVVGHKSNELTTFHCNPERIVKKSGSWNNKIYK
jgi:hypothetical protein